MRDQLQPADQGGDIAILNGDFKRIARGDLQSRDPLLVDAKVKQPIANEDIDGIGLLFQHLVECAGQPGFQPVVTFQLLGDLLAGQGIAIMQGILQQLGDVTSAEFSLWRRRAGQRSDHGFGGDFGIRSNLGIQRVTLRDPSQRRARFGLPIRLSQLIKPVDRRRELADIALPGFPQQDEIGMVGDAREHLPQFPIKGPLRRRFNLVGEYQMRSTLAGLQAFGGEGQHGADRVRHQCAQTIDQIEAQRIIAREVADEQSALVQHRAQQGHRRFEF